MNDLARRVLLVDDNRPERALLEEFLGRHGMTVLALDHAERVVDILTQQKIDVVLLDVHLPGEDGLALCRRLRALDIDIPVIFVTAMADPIDRILGLEMGADDYVIKPFEPRELLARIGAVLRRPGKSRERACCAGSKRIYTFGDFKLNVGRRTLSKAGLPIALPQGQFALLQALVSRPGQPLSRERLSLLARGQHFAPDRSLDIQISRLRRIIEADFAHPQFLHTIWGFGYVFIVEAQNVTDFQ